MNKDHDYQRMIADVLNMNTSDIETFNDYEKVKYSFNLCNAEKEKDLVYPYCASFDYGSNGFYKRRIVH